MIGPPAAEDEVDRATVRQLADALAASAGVHAVADAAAGAVPASGRRRAPAGRWCAGCAGCGPTRCAGCTSSGAAGHRRGVHRRRAAHLAAGGRRRAEVGGRAVACARSPPGPPRRCPPVWAPALTTAARSRLGDLPDALDRAVASTDLGTDRTPLWWRAVGLLQWLLARWPRWPGWAG